MILSQLSKPKRRHPSQFLHSTITIYARTPDTDEEPNGAMMRMWYVSAPFEVVCVTDQADEDGDGDVPEALWRQWPLLSVDFGHAVWLEHCARQTTRYECGPKWLRFVSFPGVRLEHCLNVWVTRCAVGSAAGPDGSFKMDGADTDDTKRASGNIFSKAGKDIHFVLWLAYFSHSVILTSNQ